jgi:RHS repeat-associated protein
MLNAGWEPAQITDKLLFQGLPRDFTYPDGGPTFPGGLVTYTYDLNDRLTDLSDSNIGNTPNNGDTHYVYDGYNRITSVTDAYSQTIGYSNYDAASNLGMLTYPDGKTVSYTYDALNRVKTATIGWLNVTATYNYYNSGTLQSLAQFNGTTVNYNYDGANRLTSLVNSTSSGAVIAAYAYNSIDGNGNRKQVAVTGAGAVSTDGITYNASYTYTTGNRLEGYTYDNEGQLQNAGGVQYSFDALHRLIGYGSQSYLYDPAGHRLMAAYGSVTTRYVYDASGNLLVEEDANGNILKYFIYGKGLLAWVDAASSNLYCYHFDGNANTVAVTDANQNVVNSYGYDPYGTVTSQLEQTTPVNTAQPFKFVGQFGVMAEPNGLYYMRARYYDPSVGRFISEDPLGLGGGDTNLYVYVQNNPIMNIDPNGQWWIGAGIGFVAGGIGGFTSGMIGHSSLWGSVLGGIAGGTAGALAGTVVGGALPDIIGTPAATAAGALAGGVFGGAIGGAVTSWQEGSVSGQAMVTGAITGGFAALIAAPGLGLAAWATGGSELATGLMGTTGGIMGTTVVATGQAIYQSSSCGH